MFFVCAITVIRGTALYGRLWIGGVLFIWLAGFLCGRPSGQHKGRGSRMSGSAAWR
jgi:hypothetical protein